MPGSSVFVLNLTPRPTLACSQELVLAEDLCNLRTSAFTSPGSSGSPVFDITGELVALHRAGGPRGWQELAQSGAAPLLRSGRREDSVAIPMDAILTDLHLRALAVSILHELAAAAAGAPASPPPSPAGEVPLEECGRGWGVGLQVERDDAGSIRRCRIAAAAPEVAGELCAGDEVVAVNGEPVRGLSGASLRALLEAAAGVALTVRRSCRLFLVAAPGPTVTRQVRHARAKRVVKGRGGRVRRPCIAVDRLYTATRTTATRTTCTPP
jgi:hypothetical protein